MFLRPCCRGVCNEPQPQTPFVRGLSQEPLHHASNPCLHGGGSALVARVWSHIRQSRMRTLVPIPDDCRHLIGPGPPEALFRRGLQRRPHRSPPRCNPTKSCLPWSKPSLNLPVHGSGRKLFTSATPIRSSSVSLPTFVSTSV